MEQFEEFLGILFDVKYFIHGVFDSYGRPVMVHAVCVDKERLSLTIFTVGSIHKRKNVIKKFKFLKWTTEMVQETRKMESLQEFLDVNSKFAVWGDRQFQLFKRIFPKVVHVSNLLVKVFCVLPPWKLYMCDEPPLTIGKTIQHVVCKFDKKFHPKTRKVTIDEVPEMKKWIKKYMWSVLLDLKPYNDAYDAYWQSTDSEESEEEKDPKRFRGCKLSLWTPISIS